jgi:hypothetical protein
MIANTCETVLDICSLRIKRWHIILPVLLERCAIMNIRSKRVPPLYTFVYNIAVAGRGTRRAKWRTSFG